jgi:hypothetical protein
MNGVIGLAFKQQYMFAAAKKVKMELTIRTPYKTILSHFDGFSRVLAKTNEVPNLVSYLLRLPLSFKIESLLPVSSCLLGI